MEGKEPDEEMRKKILHNWALKLASLVLAVILWFLVVIINDPQDSKRFSNIPVKLINTELLTRENKVYEVLDNTDKVNVTVRAPGSVIEQLRTGDIVAEADVSKITDINTIVINFDIPNVSGWDSIVGNHDVLKLSVEDRKTKWIKVNYDIVGEVAENYMVSSASLDQTQIEISGPESAIESVSYAGVQIDVTGATTSQSANVDISLYNRDGKLIEHDGIKKNYNYVHMTVEVLATKEIPVEIHYMGIPAEGYMATGVVQSDPETVKIAGTSYVLNGVNKITIPEERLNITGEKGDMKDIVNIRDYLPDNVRLADSTFNGRITATVFIEPIREKTLQIPLENVTIINVPDGMQAKLPEGLEYYTLKVSGLSELIEPLRQTEITGTIDIAAWMEQQEITELDSDGYIIPVTFTLGEEVTAEDVTVWLRFEKSM